MSRSICILFVALAIIQTVIAGVVNHREIVNLELTEITSPPIDLFGVERGKCQVNTLTVGERRPDDDYWISEYNYNNNKNQNMEVLVRLKLCCGKTAHFVGAISRTLSKEVFCNTPQTLGTSMPEIIVKIPPYTDSKLFFIVASH